MKMQSLLAGIVAAGLFVFAPNVAAHGGFGGGGGGWGGHGGGGWGGHGWGGHGWGGHGWGGHGWGGPGWSGYGWGGYGWGGPGFAFYGYPWWPALPWGWGYPYYAYYPYPDYGYGAYYGNSYYGGQSYAYRDPSASPTKWIQAALAQRGYYRGTIDGQMGRETRNAIRSFQAHQGLPVTGQADARLIRALQS